MYFIYFFLHNRVSQGVGWADQLERMPVSRLNLANTSKDEAWMSWGGRGEKKQLPPRKDRVNIFSSLSGLLSVFSPELWSRAYTSVISPCFLIMDPLWPVEGISKGEGLHSVDHTSMTSPGLL